MVSETIYFMFRYTVGGGEAKYFCIRPFAEGIKKIKYKHKSLDNFMIKAKDGKNQTVLSVANIIKRLMPTHSTIPFLRSISRYTKFVCR